MSKRKNTGIIQFNIRQTVLIIAYIAFLFNYIINGYEFGTTVESVRYTLFLLLFVSLLQNRIRNIVIYIQGGLLILTALISSYCSDVISFSTSRVWQLILCIVVFISLSTIYIHPKSFEKIIIFYTNLALILAIIVVLGYFMKFGIDRYGRASINYGEFYKDQNYLSAYFMPAFAIKMYDVLIKKNKTMLNLIYPFFYLLASLLMGSRGTFLTAIIISFLILLKLLLFEKGIVRKVCMIILLMLGAGIAFIVLYDSSLFVRMTDFENYGSDIRILLWKAGLKGFWSHPLFGSGIGAASQYAWYYVGNAVHNSFIEILADQGIIGASIIIWIFLKILTVKSNDKFLILSFCAGLFLPLFFLTGYSNMTFWMPMFFMQNFLTYIKSKDANKISKGE